MKFSRSTLRPIAALMLLCVLMAFLTKGLAAATAMFVAGSFAIEALKEYKPGQFAFLRIYTGVSLAEIFIPEVYADIQVNDSVESSAFSQSGVVTTNPLLQGAANSGTKKIEVPIWNDLDSSSEPNYSTATDDEATPDKVDTDSLNARNSYLNNGWAAADLAREVGKATPGQGDPMTRIKNRIAAYWTRQFQARVIAVCRGIFNANVAQDSSDMVHSIAAESTGAQGDATKISADAVVEAVFTMGDKFENIVAIAMHSTVYKRLVLQNLIETIKDAEGKILYTMYLGKRVIVDDGLPVIAGTTSGFKYLTVLFGTSAIGYGEGTPTKPTEVERKPSGGNGGGLETLWDRKTWLIHPQGFDWLENTVSGVESPTLADLRLAANWNRILPRKTIPLAFLMTN